MKSLRYGVWLHDTLIGHLHQRGDFTWFLFDEDYVTDPKRHILGLAFEDDLRASYASALRLPPWFSNLLPEGRLREWIAIDRAVSADREMELLAQVGSDLPGAVRVLPDEWDPSSVSAAPPTAGSLPYQGDEEAPAGWRFSLAGVGLKFSMLEQGDRLTLPAFGRGGDWIVKLPDPDYEAVPTNEYTMMLLAQRAGINVPECRLIGRSEVDSLPPDVWKRGEEVAYAVRRFDRLPDRSLVHIEDFAQVRSRYPYGGGKYEGNFESLAAVAYRQHDVEALREFVRRLVFNVLIANGDAHMKNWSLIYENPRIPTLSPAYDLVSTSVYRPSGVLEDLGLKLGGSRRFDAVTLHSFSRLAERLKAPQIDLASVAEETVTRAVDGWPEVAGLLDSVPAMRDEIGEGIMSRSKAVLRRGRRS